MVLTTSPLLRLTAHTLLTEDCSKTANACFDSIRVIKRTAQVTTTSFKQLNRLNYSIQPSSLEFLEVGMPYTLILKNNSDGLFPIYRIQTHY